MFSKKLQNVKEEKEEEERKIKGRGKKGERQMKSEEKEKKRERKLNHLQTNLTSKENKYQVSVAGWKIHTLRVFVL